MDRLDDTPDTLTTLPIPIHLGSKRSTLSGLVALVIAVAESKEDAVVIATALSAALAPATGHLFPPTEDGMQRLGEKVAHYMESAAREDHSETPSEPDDNMDALPEEAKRQLRAQWTVGRA